MKLLYWVTTLNGEILAHLRYVLENTHHDVLLATDTWDKFQNEAYYRFWPLNVRVVDKKKKSSLVEILRFNADTVIIDNHVPPFPVARSMFVIWHGFGWKGPQDRREFASFFRQTARNVGRIDVPNPYFIWKAYGGLDYEQRIDRMELPPENVVQLGMAAADDVLNLKVNRAEVSEFYGFDATKKNILIAPTWHYDAVFSHWGDDTQIFENLFKLARDLDANIILRMHDRHRYSPEYVAKIEAIARKTGNIKLKYKNEYTDNTVDMLISDVMLTNFSSIANPFYATLKPTVHIYPVKREGDEVVWRKLTSGGVKQDETIKKELIWKLDLTENGGSVAYSEEEMKNQLIEALENPEIHAGKAKSFNDKYIYKCDGKTCRRITDAVERQNAELPGCLLPPVFERIKSPSFVFNAIKSLF